MSEIKGLYAKMAAIMAGIGSVDKDAKMNAGQLQYHYVTDVQVYHLVRKLLIEHRVALIASMVDVQQDRYMVGEDKYGNPKDKYHTRAKFEFTLVDSDTGESATGTWYAESEDSGDKGINKCSTAALKYWLLKTFIIPTGDDPDDVPSGQFNAPAPKPAQKPAQNAQSEPPASKPASALDEHFGPRPPLWQPDGDDSLLDAGTWAKLSAWMVTNMANIKANEHAANALWVSIGEHIDDLLDDEKAQAAMRVVVEEKSFARLFKAKLTVADVYEAIQSHYASKPAA